MARRKHSMAALWVAIICAPSIPSSASRSWTLNLTEIPAWICRSLSGLGADQPAGQVPRGSAGGSPFNGRGALAQHLGLPVAALLPVQLAEVVEHGGDVGVLRAERLLQGRQSPPVERLGLGGAALFPV